MRRPRAQCPKSQGIKGHVERDEAVLRYVDRGPSIDRRRRQRRQRVEEEGSSTLGVLRLPGGEMVLVATEPHPEPLESLFAEPVFQPVEAVGLGFGSLALPVVIAEQRAFTAAQAIDCDNENVHTAEQEAELCKHQLEQRT